MYVCMYIYIYIYIYVCVLILAFCLTGLLAKPTHDDIIRLAPPLTINTTLLLLLYSRYRS